MAEEKTLEGILSEINKQIIEDTKNHLKPYRSLVEIGATYAQQIKASKNKNVEPKDLDMWVKALFQCNNQIIKAYSGNIDLRVYVAEKSDLVDNKAINYEKFYQIDFTDFDFIKKHLKFDKQNGFTFNRVGLSTQKGTSNADKLSDELYRITSQLTGYLGAIYSNPDNGYAVNNIKLKAAEGSKKTSGGKLRKRNKYYRTEITYPGNVTHYINFNFVVDKKGKKQQQKGEKRQSQKKSEVKISPYYAETSTEVQGSYFSYAWLREHSLEIGRKNANMVQPTGIVDEELLYNLVRQTFLQKVDHVPAARIGDVRGENKEDFDILIGSTQVKAGRYHLMSYNQIEQMAEAFIKMNQYISSDDKLEQLIKIYYNTNTNFQMSWDNLTNVIEKAEEDIINKNTNKLLKLLETINEAKADISKEELLKNLDII